MRILLIEGNPIFQVQIRNLIEGLGFDFLLAKSLLEAQVFFDAQNFEMLICEVVLSDGLSFDMEDFPRVPTIFISSHEETTYMERAININDAFFLVKPFANLTLVGAIRKIQKKHAYLQEYVGVFGKNKNPIQVPMGEVELISSEGNYTTIVTLDNARYIIKRSAKDVLKGTTQFIRIQRSVYVNKRYLVKLSLNKNVIYTKNNELSISKQYRKNIYEFHHLDK